MRAGSRVTVLPCLESFPYEEGCVGKPDSVVSHVELAAVAPRMVWSSGRWGSSGSWLIGQSSFWDIGSFRMRSTMSMRVHENGTY